MIGQMGVPAKNFAGSTGKLKDLGDL